MKRNKLIVEYVKGNMKIENILDVGCADMPEISVTMPSLLHKLIIDAAPDGVEVVGYDHNKNKVQQLNSMGYKCIHGDIINPVIQTKFDLIIAGEIIEHVANQEGFIKGISSLLKPGGEVFISTPNPSGVASVCGYWLIGEERGGDGHVLWQSPKTINNLCTEEGLILTNVYHCNWDYPKPWMYLIWPLELFPRMRPTLLFKYKKPKNSSI